MADKDKAQNEKMRNALIQQIDRNTKVLQTLEQKVGNVRSEADKSQK